MMKRLIALWMSLLMSLTAANAAALGNPWTDTTEEAFREQTGMLLRLPDGAEDVRWRLLAAQALGEVQFRWNGWDCTARMVKAEEPGDISGLYYEPWDAEEEVTIAGCMGVIRRDAAGPVSVCQWYDGARLYSFSVIGEGADEADPAAMAEEIFCADAAALHEALTGCTGYAGSAGASLKAARGACGLLAFVVAHGPDAPGGTARAAWAALSEDKQAELALNLPGIDRLIRGALAGDADALATLADAGVTEEFAPLLSEGSAAAWEAFAPVLAEICGVELD